MSFTAIDHDLLQDTFYISLTSAEKGAWLALLVIAGEKTQVCSLGCIPQAWFPKILSGKLGIDQRTIVNMMQKAKECGKVSWSVGNIRIECPIYRGRILEKTKQLIVSRSKFNASPIRDRSKAGADLQQGCSNPVEDATETGQVPNTIHTSTYTYTGTHNPPFPPKGGNEIDYDFFLIEWNSMAAVTDYEPVDKLTKRRRERICECLMDEDFDFMWLIAMFREYLPRVETKERIWKPDLDWVIKSRENYMKILEGKFTGGRINPRAMDSRV